MKEDFFSKFRDYNNELEKILDKKDFSKDVKNLLLSIFYKLESSYEDYETVKKRVKSKQAYLENILDNIKQCQGIQIIKPNDPEFSKWTEENKKYEVDLKLKKITAIENEISLLSALLEMNDFKIYLGEKYNLIRNSYPYLLNAANDMNQTEVLRDFNAFSWNISAKDIKNIPINLVYQNLNTLLTMNIVETLEQSYTNQDIVQLTRKNMEGLYETKLTEKFLLTMFKISILIYIQKSDVESKRLQEEYKNIEQELEFIKNKKEYVTHAIETKMELSQKIKNIDLIVSDKKLLIKEYERRNQSLSEYHKIFSLSDLTEKLQREKARMLNKIEEYNKSLDPKKYIENKQKLQNDLNLLKQIDFDDTKNNQKLLYQLIDQLQILFLEKLLPQKIQALNDKEELIELMYELRYDAFLMYNAEKHVKDVAKFQGPLKKVIEILLKKMYQLKIINTISTNEKKDIQVVSNILFSSIINLEDIYLELTQLDKASGKYKLTIFDGKDTIATTQEIILEFHTKDRIKLKRKIKLF